MFQFNHPTLKSHIKESGDYIRSVFNLQPQLGLVLGSGFGAFIEKGFQVQATIDFKDIPHFLSTGVVGHKGKVILGKIQDVPTIALQGRLHCYEGYSMQQVVFPIYTMIGLGIEVLLCTNAAGGINQNMSPGDFMIINDHINLMGNNPLVGEKWEKPFLDISEAYNKKLIQKMIQAFEKENISVHEGVYCGMLGPCYESPAEIRFLRQVGANAVGMSTIPEIICAHHVGIRCAAISCITNLAAGLGHHKLDHKEVMETMQGSLEKFTCFLSRFAPLIKE